MLLANDDSRVDIRKFKQWQDGEYIVRDAANSTMRLAVDGVFEEHLALANVWIQHKGHDVAVGSGFTASERIKFAKDPSLIVRVVPILYVSRTDNPRLGRKSQLDTLRRVQLLEGRRE
jgi:DNA ligase-1